MILKTNDLKLLVDFLTSKEIKRVEFSEDSINCLKCLRFKSEDITKKEYDIYVYPTEIHKERDLYKPVQISITELLSKIVKS